MGKGSNSCMHYFTSDATPVPAAGLAPSPCDKRHCSHLLTKSLNNSQSGAGFTGIICPALILPLGELFCKKYLTFLSI